MSGPDIKAIIKSAQDEAEEIGFQAGLGEAARLVKAGLPGECGDRKLALAILALGKEGT